MADFRTERRAAEAIARRAGRQMTRQRRGGFDVEMKGTNDPVTEIDVAVEEFLFGELESMFPDDAVVGEETEERDTDNDRTWYVDPIDGTLNFSRGIPMYCVSIALQKAGRSVVGVVYDPSRDELFSASKGDGARLDGAPMTVSDVSDLGEALLVTGFPRSLADAEVDNIRHFAELTRASRGVRRLGSAALDLAYVAAGRLDGFWEYHLNPWDTAAGYLLVEEAGGIATDTGGAPFTSHEPSVLATNPELHETICKRLADL